MSKRIKVKFDIGDYVFTPEGAGIIRNYTITNNNDDIQIEYEIERTRNFSDSRFCKDAHYIYCHEDEVHKNIRKLLRYLCYMYKGEYLPIEYSLKQNFNDAFGWSLQNNKPRVLCEAQKIGDIMS